MYAESATEKAVFKNDEILTGKEAKKIWDKGEDRLEYIDQYGKWQIFDHKFHRASMFKFYDQWRIY